MRQLGRLCATIVGSNFKTMRRRARRALDEGVDLVELRLDYLRDLPERELVEEISPISKSCVLTVRSKEEGGRFGRSEKERLRLLREVSRARPRHIDLELGAAEKDHRLAEELRRNCDGLIVSRHNFRRTPPRKELLELRDREMKLGEIAKVVTTAKRVEDNGTILSLYDGSSDHQLIAFCMGEAGSISRVLSILAGGPISYVRAGRKEGQVAPGQLSFPLFKELLSRVGG